MSFFKQFLSDSNKPPDRERAFEPRGSTGRHIPNEQRGPPLTLSRIRSALYDPDDEYDPYGSEKEDHVADVFRPPSFDIAPEASTVEVILQTTRKYLEAEIQAEQSRMDWSPECRFEKIELHPKGNELPEFSTAEELNNVSNASDLTIPIKKLGMDIDREMMDRIQAGLGPRPSKIEDLVERLRLEPKQSRIAATSYVQETYAELLEVLRAWNMRVGEVPDLSREREELLDTLGERCQLITEVESNRQSQEVLEQQSLRVRQTLHAFRPELKSFENQVLHDQLILLIANLGITVPDLDDELKDSVIETLYRECRAKIYLSDEHNAKREGINAEMGRAKLQGDKKEAAELMKQEIKLDRESSNQAAGEIRTAIKSARKNLYMKELVKLQSLAEQQAGQKWAACGIAKAPASALLQKCIETESRIYDMYKYWDSEVDRPLGSALLSIPKMRGLAVDNDCQVQKFAGLDKPEKERKAVVERRRNDARTPHIMTEVLNQSLEVHDMSQRVLEHMNELSYSLDCILEAAGTKYEAYSRVLANVDQGELCCEHNSWKGGVDYKRK